MNLKPLNTKVFVKRIALPEKSEGGIIIPENVRKNSGCGEIIAKGPGTKETPTDAFEVGDKVLFSHISGIELPYKYSDGSDLLQLEWTQLHGSYTEEDELNILIKQSREHSAPLTV